MNTQTARKRNTARSTRKAAASAIIASALCCMFLAACSQNAPQPAQLSEPVEDVQVNAVVVSIDGDTLRIRTGDDAGDRPDGQPPKLPDAPPPAPPQQDTAASPDGQAAPPDGQAPSQAGSEGEGAPPAAPPAPPEEEGSPSQQAEDGTPEAPEAPEAPEEPEASGASTAPDTPDAPDSSQALDSSQAPDDADTMEKMPIPLDPPRGVTAEELDGSAEESDSFLTLTVPDESIIYDGFGQDAQHASLSDIKENDMLLLEVENGTDVTRITLHGNMMDATAGHISNGTGATTFTSNAAQQNATYTSSAPDENALRVEAGAEVSVGQATVTKTGDTTLTEDSDFYGLNAGVLAFDGSSLDIAGGTVETNALGATGIYSQGQGTKVKVSNVQVRTHGDYSGGIEISGGASLTAENLTVDTQGRSSAAIRSDRDGGTQTVTGGTYTTHGEISPAVYSTANVTVNDATLASDNTETLAIEGRNSLTLNNCTVTGNTNGHEGWSGVVPNVQLYQSAESWDNSLARFTMNGGSFTATHGTLIYATNTTVDIALSKVAINNTGDSLMLVAGNDTWGISGDNGATVRFTATEQELSGDITVDAISSLDFSLDAASSFEGAINPEETAGTVNVDLAEGAIWKLTDDAHVSSLSGDTAGIDLNGHELYVEDELWGHPAQATQSEQPQQTAQAEQAGE